MISVPISLKYIKLGNYQKFLQIENPSTEDLIKCLLEVSSPDLARMKATDVDHIAAELNELFEVDHQFVNQFELYGKRFGFIPKLDDITYGENKDITNYINDWGNMHKAMAVLFRPIEKKLSNQYIIEDYEGSHVYSDVMKDMPLSVVLGSMVFFYNLTNELLNYIPNYLEKQISKEQMIEVDLQGSGEVILNSIRLLKETLQDLIPSQNINYTNA
tara:strand:+ start:347 stop:994 length:648 start_codon:yes stop_codon:yes gene_type:complete